MSHLKRGRSFAGIAARVAKRHIPLVSQLSDFRDAMIAAKQAMFGSGAMDTDDAVPMDIDTSTDSRDADVDSYFDHLRELRHGRQAHADDGFTDWVIRVYPHNVDSSGNFLDPGSHTFKGFNRKMPRRASFRNRYGKRRYFRRRGGRRGRGNYLYSTKKIQKVINKNIELKHHTVCWPVGTITQAALAFNNSGQILELSSMAAGQGSHERIGTKIQHVAMTLKGKFTEVGGDFQKGKAKQVRMIVFYEKMVEGLIPLPQDLLHVDISLIGDNILAMKNIDRGKGFYILWDKTWTMGGASHPEEVTFQKSFKLKRASTFQGTTALIANQWMNHIYALIWHDSTEVSGFGVNGHLCSRLRYRDA